MYVLTVKTSIFLPPDPMEEISGFPKPIVRVVYESNPGIKEAGKRRVWVKIDTISAITVISLSTCIGEIVQRQVYQTVDWFSIPSKAFRVYGMDGDGVNNVYDATVNNYKRHFNQWTSSCCGDYW